MPRERDPNRDRAFEIWRKSKGKIDLVDIASQLELSAGTIRGWKSKDSWEEKLNGTFQKAKRSVPKQRSERSNQTVTDPSNVSWADIENDYVTDIRKKPYTLQALSEKYSVPLQTIKDYAARHAWTDKRSKHYTVVVQKTAEKAADILSDDIAKATAKHFRISDKLLAVVERTLDNPVEFNTIVEKIRTGHGPGEFNEKIVAQAVDAINDAKLLNVVNAFEKLQKAQRQTLRILDEKDKQKIDLDKLKAGDGDGNETEDDGFMEALKGKVSEVWADENGDSESTDE